MLLGWDAWPRSIDAGPPPILEDLFAAALIRCGVFAFLHARQRFIRQRGWLMVGDDYWLRLPRTLEDRLRRRPPRWLTASSRADRARSLFDGVTSWSQQAQIGLLLRSGPPPAVTRKHDESFDTASAALQTVWVTIDQLSPAFSNAGANFVWEAHVSGLDPEACTYTWSIRESGPTTVLFRQTTWIGSTAITSPGTYTLHVAVSCSGAGTGAADLIVDVCGVAPPIAAAPPAGSNIRPATSDANAPNGATVCTMWTAWDYDTDKYFLYRNSACSGGAARQPLTTMSGTWELL